MVHLCNDNVWWKWAWLCSTAANCTQHAKIHFISTATVKWQTKLVLLWIVNLAARTVLPSAVYITMHMTGYNNTVQVDLILMQTDLLFVFQWKRSKLHSIATEKKTEERMIVVFMRAVPACIWTGWEGLAEGWPWTIFGYGREIMGLYRSRHENTNKSSCAISCSHWFFCRSLEEVLKNDQNLCVIYTNTHTMCSNVSQSQKSCTKRMLIQWTQVTTVSYRPVTNVVRSADKSQFQWARLREFTVRPVFSRPICFRTNVMLLKKTKLFHLLLIFNQLYCSIK